MADFDDEEHEGNDNDEAGDDDDDDPGTETAAPGASDVAPASARKRPRAQAAVSAAAPPVASGAAPAVAPWDAWTDAKRRVGGETEEATQPRQRPRAQSPAAGPPSPFGGVPLHATAWGIRKRNDVGGAYSGDLSWNAPGDTIALREWPIADLSETTVRQRWGAGTYQVHWLRTSERGGRDHVSYGREITLVPAVTPPAGATPTAPAVAGGLAEALQIMNIIDSQANAKIAGMAQLAQAIAGGNRGGLDAETLRTILAESRTATVEAVRVAVEPLHKALIDDGDGDDDGEAAGVGDVARAAAPFVKGKGKWPMLLNFAQSNPEVAQKIVGAAISAAATAAAPLVAALAEAFKPPAPPPPPAPAPLSLHQAPRPRAVPRNVVVEQQPQADDAPAVTSGLSSAAAPRDEAPGPDRYAPPTAVQRPA